MMTLLEAELEKSYTFVGFLDEEKVDKHMNDLGFVKGTPVRVLSKNKKSSFIVLIQNSRIAIDQSLASLISVEERDTTGEEKFTTLETLTVGSQTVVERVLGKGNVKRRLMDMGITKGVNVTIRKVAPLGDPIEISIRGYELTLRKDEAGLILVKDVRD